ncbi:hypothetical protein FKG94_19620 [Exilibacterium tricleocarpae]|uniref:Uncharacterized protein n=1 Tax=Exilibacterium tricleocarpae TaxID=2591008 RepID=A0A545T2A6_9GAMM|nr:hypothetical protein [Exilibacterium tricleocarpae]TQV71325.1 hypothetical protein FKG94_19620 [Exilibacterium tricleocarpae]
MKRFMLSVVLSLFSFTSYSNVECKGEVAGVTLSPSGQLHVKKFKNWRWIKICSVHNTINNTSPEACRAIYSLLLAAQVSKKEVSFWFNEGDCQVSSQTPWTLLNSWYFGPMLVD